jgi:hypothetical protein
MSVSIASDDPSGTPPPTYPQGLPDRVAPLAEVPATGVRLLFAVMVATGLLLAVGAITDAKQFYHSYLFGYVFALDIALGAIFWVLIHHVSDAGWSVGLRRVFENMNRAILPLAVLFLPVLIGTFTGNLHAWYDFVHGQEPTEEHLKRLWHVKHTYFNTPFFLARLALYFAVWIGYSVAMRNWSTKQDAIGGAALTRKMQWWAPSGLVLLGITTTFFAFDILMSLQYSWFSTIYGVYFWVGGFRGSLATCVILVLSLRAAGYLQNTITIEHLHDVAKIMFGLTIFWAYIGFSQYFLIWYGNVPEETQFYLLRRNGSWYEASILLPILYFVVPFFMLLPRAHKRSPVWLAIISVWVVLMHAYDLYWQIMPVLHQNTVHLHWLDFAAPIFMFGVLLTATCWGFFKLPLIPIRDARLNEAIGYENETP